MLQKDRWMQTYLNISLDKDISFNFPYLWESEIIDMVERNYSVCVCHEKKVLNIPLLALSLIKHSPPRFDHRSSFRKHVPAYPLFMSPIQHLHLNAMAITFVSSCHYSFFAHFFSINWLKQWFNNAQVDCTVWAYQIL